MCVIILKRRGIEKPSKDILKKCWDRNPHGGGILIHRPKMKNVEIHKGYMSFNDYCSRIDSLNIGIDDDVVYHLRITTSGGTCPENCHPFPVSGNIVKLKKRFIRTKRAFVHNGVFGPGDEKLKLSDTQLFVKNELNRKEIQDHFDDEGVRTFLKTKAALNRFVVIDAEKDIFDTYGDWYTDSKTRLVFSNTYWKDSEKLFDFTIRKAKKTRFPKFDSNRLFDIPIGKILCPYCDRNMVQDEFHESIYHCHSCKIIYDDATFEIYDSIRKIWRSIPELNDFEIEPEEMVF